MTDNSVAPPDILEVAELWLEYDLDGGPCAPHLINEACDRCEIQDAMRKAIASEKLVRARREKENKAQEKLDDALFMAAKNQHDLDEQTHGLAFGVSKENCKVCKALKAYDEALAPDSRDGSGN